MSRTRSATPARSSFPAAVAQGEVDASSAVKRSFSRVRTSLVHDDLMTSVAEHAAQTAHQSRTDDGHLTHGEGEGLVEVGNQVLDVFDAHTLRRINPSVTPVFSRTSLGMLACVIVAG